jgi:hypothetical protein
MQGNIVNTDCVIESHSRKPIEYFFFIFRACLANTVQFNEEAEVKCPYRDADYACNSVLQEREIKAVSDIGITLCLVFL